MAGSVFTGVDQVRAWVNALVCVFAGALIYWKLPAAGVVIWGLTPAAVATRYRLRVSDDGIELAYLCCWFIPLKRYRYLLDANIALYESFEADAPEGVCVSPMVFSDDEVESPCFGPSSNQAAIAALHARANEALTQARKRVAPRERPRAVSTTAPLEVAGLTLPAGAALEYHHAEYLDPRRPDRLIAATVPRALTLPLGLEVPAGTRLTFTNSGRVSSVRGKLGHVRRDGFPIDGDHLIGFDDNGHVDACTLAEPFRLGGQTLPAGTTLRAWARLSCWYCAPPNGAEPLVIKK